MNRRLSLLLTHILTLPPSHIHHHSLLLFISFSMMLLFLIFISILLLSIFTPILVYVFSQVILILISPNLNFFEMIVVFFMFEIFVPL